MLRFFSSSTIFSHLESSGFYYKAPPNLNVWWNFGFLALIFLIIQIITGIFLAMSYSSSLLFAFDSVMYINNELFYGWWLRSLHANGASFFFAIVYIHMARGLYYGSFVFPRQLLWCSGVLIWVLMIVTAFLGYVLPWGQMSYWAAMVITSLFYSLPLIGSDFIFLLWGGFSISEATLQRFYSLHFFLPFVILGLSFFHLSLLHENGSSNPLGISSRLDSIPFSPYYVLKDTISLIGVVFILFFIVYISPDLLGHPDNYERANFLVTPSHIVPEWYFLPLYAVLRSVVNKLLGIILLTCFFLVLFLLPFYMQFVVRSSMFKPLNGIFVWGFFFVCFALGWIGGLPASDPYVSLGLFFTILYFVFLLVIFPLLAFWDRLLYDSYLLNKNKVSIQGSVVKNSTSVFFNEEPLGHAVNEELYEDDFSEVDSSKEEESSEGFPKKMSGENL